MLPKTYQFMDLFNILGRYSTINRGGKRQAGILIMPQHQGITPFGLNLDLKNLFRFPDNFTVYPGHGEITTLGKEKNNIELILKSFF